MGFILELQKLPGTDTAIATIREGREKAAFEEARRGSCAKVVCRVCTVPGYRTPPPGAPGSLAALKLDAHRGEFRLSPSFDLPGVGCLCACYPFTPLREEEHAAVVLAMPSLDIPGEFLRHAVLDTVVPHASDADLEAALTSALEKGADNLTSVLSLIPQRSLLFFGMLRPAGLIELYLLLICSVIQMSSAPFALSYDYPIAPHLA